MNNLPSFNTTDRILSMMQSAWATALNPLLKNPVLDGIILPNVSLSTGTNSINHRLSRPLQGWCVTRLRGAAVIYDDQDNNQMPQLTLTLVSDVDVVVDIYVF